MQPVSWVSICGLNELIFMFFSLFFRFLCCRVFSAYVKEVESKPDSTAWGKKLILGNLMGEFSNGGGRNLAASPNGPSVVRKSVGKVKRLISLAWHAVWSWYTQYPPNPAFWCTLPPSPTVWPSPMSSLVFFFLFWFTQNGIWYNMCVNMMCTCV